MPTTPVILWNPPPLLLTGMPVDSALNATASASNVAVAGTFAYTPAAGTIAAVLPNIPPYPAVAPNLLITCTFTPTDLVTYAPATAQVTIPLATAYLTPAEARVMMAGLPAVLVGTLPAQSDADLIGLLWAASVDLDVGIKYQGRRLIETQEREFPRLAYGPAPITRQFAMGYPGFFGLVYPFSADTKIWDLDLTGATTGTVSAIIPRPVKMATIYQAAWLLKGEYAERLELLKSGLASRQIGTGQEALVKQADLLGSQGLGMRAATIMETYRLRSGRIL